ncbi:MAG: ABC transporter substrate-binding protein [Lachnospiraceae bacterium]|nr:ABC transporter substrate-binding protein [Lachnospiraceae bacterium]
MRKRLIITTVFLLFILITGCGSTTEKNDLSDSEEMISDKYIVVGFSQLGAESDWRSANTESMKSTFTEENGFELIFEDGQQKQSNQIMAIRTFIQQGVDYIVLAPVIETGWDTVLQEANDAGIPVILVDRMVDVENESLYSAWVGSDFALEGAKAGEWINQFLQAKGIENANIVNIQGTLGASAQIGRTKGLREACEANTNTTLLAEVTGDFTQTKGKEVMESLLKQHDDINIVYCENDNEAFGVIEAIETAGKKVGSDIANGEIMVISFDGVKEDAMKYIMKDKITCIVECNPLQGPLVQDIIMEMEAGKVPDKFSYVDEGMYAHDDTVSSVVIDGVDYPITVVTQEILDVRAY